MFQALAVCAILTVNNELHLELGSQHGFCQGFFILLDGFNFSLSKKNNKVTENFKTVLHKIPLNFYCDLKASLKKLSEEQKKQWHKKKKTTLGNN